MNRLLSFGAAAALLAALSISAASAGPMASHGRASAVRRTGATKSMPASVHIRGTVKSLTGQTLTVTTAAGPVKVQLARPIQVTALVRSNRSGIKAGTFLGITSVTQPDGTQRAVEVHLFPESMRGAGEGSRPWDYPGHHTSKMTNGTAIRSAMGHPSGSRMTNGAVAGKRSGQALTVRYKNGSQVIVIPPGIPIVALAPGSPAELKPGSHVFILGNRNPNGTVTAGRVLVGTNGLVPPM